MSETFDLAWALDQEKRSMKRIQLLIPEAGLTEEQKNQIKKHYHDVLGVRFSLGGLLEVIKVYDRGYVFLYKCAINGKQEIIAFASVCQNGGLMIEEKKALSEKWFNDLIKKDQETIERTAIKLFPNLYSGVR